VRPLLLVMNPRDIRECVESIARLPIDRVWLRSYTERGLEEAIPRALAEAGPDYDYVLLVADDVVVFPGALDAVLALGKSYDVVTGYTRLDSTSPFVNLTRKPLAGDVPVAGSYDFYRYAEVAGYEDEVVPTGFVGFALTGMPRDLWDRFPFSALGGEPGYSSDFALSVRLRDAGIPMVAARGGYVEHVKETWNQLDAEPRKRLLLGERPSELVFDVGH
jgi:GT2 family glycosyltransferase